MAPGRRLVSAVTAAAQGSACARMGST